MYDPDIAFFIGLAVGFLLGVGAIYFGLRSWVMACWRGARFERTEYRRLIREMEGIEKRWREESDRSIMQAYQAGCRDTRAKIEEEKA